MLSQSDRPTQFGYFSHLDLSYQQWSHQLTEISMWQILHGFLKCFSPECSVFYSTEGDSSRHKMDLVA
jgi:hypothetical protein